LGIAPFSAHYSDIPRLGAYRIDARVQHVVDVGVNTADLFFGGVSQKLNHVTDTIAVHYAMCV
jgi:hypothetical protein